MTAIKLYTRENIDQLEWPSDSHYERDYMLPMMRLGTTHFFSNIQTELQLLQLESFFFPLTINETEYQNAYTCSPYTA